MINKLLGISLIFLGLKVLIIRDFSGNWGEYKFSYFYLHVPVSFLLFYIAYLFIKYSRKEKQEKYSKCPRCKESFNYNELEKGKCKYCKDIETIELEEYYKKYPQELKEE